MHSCGNSRRRGERLCRLRRPERPAATGPGQVPCRYRRKDGVYKKEVPGTQGGHHGEESKVSSELSFGGVKLTLVTDRFRYEAVWVAMNWRITLPTPETHPKFPLWKLGYSPEDVYDLFFPRDFNFICDPARPSVCGRFGKTEDRLWRYEFVVKDGEDGQQMSTFEEITEIVFPYLTHRGSQYG